MAKTTMEDAIRGSYGTSRNNNDSSYLSELEKNIRKHYEAMGKSEEEIVKKTQDAINRIVLKGEKKTIAERLKAFKELNDEELKYATSTSDKIAANLKNTLLKTIEVSGKALSAATSGINDYINVYDKYMTGIEARIQGSGQSFNQYTSTISKAIGSSQYVSQTKVLEKLSSLVEQGIVYNVEQRAFLGTVAEKIATTFDVANGTLLKIIRLQRADSTAARLGMEAYLTQLLNAQFKDSSYLNNSSNITSTLYETLSQAGLKGGVELEYVAQKWLGSLSSVGMSDSTIQTLAQGLNYLGTGDISGLTGNESLMRLMTKASGGDLTGILTGGLTANTANTLLSNIVNIVKDLGSISNNVVRQNYASLYGLTLSDVTAVMNLSSKDLSEISKNMLTYSEAVAETTSQLESIPDRMHLSSRINTMMENILASSGANIANNAALYTTWTLANMVEKATGGISIPWVGGTVEGTLKAGIVGLSTLSNINAILSGLSGANNLSLGNWGAKEALTYGAGYTGIKMGSRSTSAMSYIGTGSGDELYEESVISAREKAGESPTEKIEGAQAETLDQIRDITEAIYQILYRVSGYGQSVFKVDTEANGYIANLNNGYQTFGSL